MKKWGKFLVFTLTGILFAAVISYAINNDAVAAEASETEAEAVTATEVVILNQNAVAAPSEIREIEVLEREEPWCPAMEDIKADRQVQTPLPPEITEPAEEDEEPGEIIDAEPEEEEPEPENEVVFGEDEEYDSFVDADGNVWYIGKFLDEDNQDYDDGGDDSEDEYVEDEDEPEDEESDEDDFDWTGLPVIDLAPIEFDPEVNYLFSE